MVQSLTLKQLGCCVRWTATERVQLASRLKLIAEAKVGNLDIQVIIQQQILSLSTTMFNIRHRLETPTQIPKNPPKMC